MKMNAKYPLNRECIGKGYNTKSCLIAYESNETELVNVIKKFFEKRGYGIKIKKPGFKNADDFCKFCEDAHSTGFGIVIGNSLFELGFLSGIGKLLILTNAPQWIKKAEIDNVAYLEKTDHENLHEELKGVKFEINEKLKKQMAGIFVNQEISQDVREQLEKLSEILLEHDFSLSAIKKIKTKDVEISPEDKYLVTEIINELASMELDMTSLYYLNIGRFFFEVKEYANSIKQFENALYIDPENVEALTDLGSAYYYSKKYKDAIEYFKRASEIEPENVYALHTTGMSYVHLKKPGNGIEYLKKAVKVEPESMGLQKYEIYTDMGIVYNYLEEDDERYYKAIDCFNKSLNIENNSRAWRNMGATYIHLKEYDKAITCFENALRIEPGNARVMCNIGGIYFRTKNYSKAIEYFKKAIDVEPNNADAYYALGLIHNTLKNYNEAIGCLKTATDIDPEHADAWWDLGFTYIHLDDYSKALEHFKKASEVNHEYVDAWNSMGATYTKLGKYKDAWKCYETVIHLLPDYVPGKLNLAENYIIRGCEGAYTKDELEDVGAGEPGGPLKLKKLQRLMYENAFTYANEALKIAKENKNDRDICISYFLGIVSLLFQPSRVADGKVWINEFRKYFKEKPQKVDWDISVITSVANESDIKPELNNLIQALGGLLENRISIEEFDEIAKPESDR